MKKLISLFVILTTIITGCSHAPVQMERKLIGETVIDYHLTDSNYRLYGYYREVFRKYNYQYSDSTYYFARTIDKNHSVNCFINEYGDTVSFVYIDFSNYPRRDD